MAESPANDPVPHLASLVATALSDPMLFGMREGLKASLGVGAGTSVALIALRIRERVAVAETKADDLRALIHRHLKEHPGLSAWETAAALKTDAVPVRNLLYAMAEDGVAEPDTTGPVTRWTAT